MQENKKYINGFITEYEYTQDQKDEEENVTVCAKFGCGEHLTLREKLFGKFCCRCAKRIKNDNLFY